MKLTVVITCLNDPHVEATCRSIRETAGDRPEIVVVDDCSATPVSIDPSLKVLVVHNRFRVGVGPSRTIGVYHAEDFVLLCDSHMRFTEGWYENAMRRMEGRPHTIHCPVCLGLDANNMDPATARQVYQGATINVCGPDRQKKDGYQVLEGCWMPGDTADDAELACVMGGAYFISKEWFLKLDALSHLRSWGSDEVMLSIRSWLHGGDVRFMKNVRIGHRFLLPKEKQPYSVIAWHPIYNKLFAVHTLCDACSIDFLAEKVRNTTNATDYNWAKSHIKEDWHIVHLDRMRSQANWKHDFRWFCQKFALALPPELA